MSTVSRTLMKGRVLSALACLFASLMGSIAVAHAQSPREEWERSGWKARDDALRQELGKEKHDKLDIDVVAQQKKVFQDEAILKKFAAEPEHEADYYGKRLCETAADSIGYPISDEMRAVSVAWCLISNKDGFKNYAARVALRAGRLAPENCTDWFYAKGQYVEKLTAPVSNVSLTPPKGTGKAIGEVTQISGRTLQIALFMPLVGIDYNEPAILLLGDKAKIFNGEKVRVGVTVRAYGNQTSVRNGQIPVIQVACLE
ncbi:hypothetical protein P3G55_20210 [Leptospira sp. 96542]|nr:hypothetical protein [Leptospira sp. 96542]